MKGISMNQSFLAGAKSSLAHELSVSPPILGRIRLGPKIPTLNTSKNPRAMDIYRKGVRNGSTFQTIEKEIEAQCQIKNPLRPENKPYFTIRPSDFSNPSDVQKLMDLYGEDKENGEGIQIYSLPILFPFEDINKIMPNGFSAWRASKREYFSEYDSDGNRYCMKYAEPEKTPQSTRVVRSFGLPTKVFRIDSHIDRVCDPSICPEFQNKKCNLDLNLLFLIPGITGAGVFKSHSTSIVSLKNWYSVLSMVQLSKGSFRNVKFTLTKKLTSIPYIDDEGKPAKANQWITELTSDLDIIKMMSVNNHLSQDHIELISIGESAAATLDGKMSKNIIIDTDCLDARHIALKDYLKKLSDSGKSQLEQTVLTLKAYLKYLHVDLEMYEQYVTQKYGNEWFVNEAVLKSEVHFVSTSTTSEILKIIQTCH